MEKDGEGERDAFFKGFKGGGGVGVLSDNTYYLASRHSCLYGMMHVITYDASTEALTAIQVLRQLK